MILHNAAFHDLPLFRPSTVWLGTFRLPLSRALFLMSYPNTFNIVVLDTAGIELSY